MPFPRKIYIEDDGMGLPEKDCLRDSPEEVASGPYLIVCCLKHRNEYVKNGTFVFVDIYGKEQDGVKAEDNRI